MSQIKRRADSKEVYDEEKYFKRNDNIYYNVKILNNSVTESKIARYIETRLTSVIGDNARDYYCAVARFKVPSASIPIFIFQEGEYSVTLRDTAGSNWTSVCHWIDNGSDTGYVWSYHEWALSVTNALLSAYIAMPALLQPAHPPFVLFDAVTQRFTLYATDEYNSTPGDGTKTQIWMNVGTYSKFDCWQTVFGNPSSSQFANILIKSTGNNQVIADFKAASSPPLNCAPAVDGVTYLAQQQEVVSLFLLSDFDTLVLTSNSIPVNPEQYGSIDGVSTQIQSNVITDFQPDLNNDISSRGYMIYTPFIYRWFDVPSSSEVRTLDLQIFWRDVRGVLRPIYIYYNDVVDMKLLFQKKYKHVVVDKNLD